MIFNNFNSRFPLKKNFFHLVSNVFYFSLLIKKLIRFIYIKVAIINNKTIDIKEVIEKGEAYQNLIFEGEIFNFSPKLDILNKKSICFPKGTYQVPNYYIYNFKNCFIKAFSNSIFDKYGRKIIGIDFQELTFDFHIIWDLGKINLNYIDGVVLVLGIGSLEKNYSHAWTELAARAFASSFSNFAYDYVLIDYENEFSREIIKLIGISEKKIIVSSRYEYIAAKQILYPQLINNFAEYFLNGVTVYQRKFLPYWLMNLYQEIPKKILNQDNNILLKKIYVSRRNKKYRRIINEKALINALEELGFNIIYFEDYSIVDQIKIANQASQIIAIHGAGLVNINFCKKGTKILELFPSNYHKASFYMHSIMSKLDYSFYIGETNSYKWRQRPIMQNFNVNIKVIKHFIQENW